MNRPMLNSENTPPRMATITPMRPPATSTPSDANVCGVICSDSNSDSASKVVPKAWLTHVASEASSVGMPWIRLTACVTSRFPNAAVNRTAKTTMPSMTTPVASPRRICRASRLTAGSMAMLASQAMMIWNSTEPPSCRTKDPNE